VESKSIVVGTAGHIDHGKTALVRALTGVDTDRLDEEKRRGITIDLGFAPLDLEGVHIGFVDVPGHERFVKNMLAGAGGIDAVLIVVAADESVMPQTREHVEICDLLEIGVAVVAITKTDLVDAETIELVALEVSELLEGTRFAGARIVEVSSVTGAGLDQLRSALIEIAGGIQARNEALIARLPVDRVFTMKGFGTVVTGTLVSGTLKSGMAVELQPSGKTTSVKNLQVHGESVEQARAGHRVAVNLGGLGKDEIERGEVVVPAKSLKPASTLDLHCRVLPSSPCELATNQRVRFHIGSAELIGRLQILSGRTIGIGETGFARIRLESPASALIGDRYVIRRYSPMVTIAGGTVLDNRPPRLRDRRERIDFLGEMQRAGLRDRCALLIESRRGAVTSTDLTAAFGLLEKEGELLLKEFIASGKTVLLSEQPLNVCSASYMDAAEQALLGELKRAHEESPYADGIGLDVVRRGLPSGADESIFRAAIDRMQESGKLSVTGGQAVLGGHKVELTPEQRKVMDGISAALREGAFAPPPASQVIAENGGAKARPIFNLMVSRAELVKIADDFYYHSETLEQVVATIRRNAEGGSFSVPQFKDWFGISRKFAIPLLEYLDSSGVTYRDGDARKLRNG
jgi:selenocysteine-specific elongation factor